MTQKNPLAHKQAYTITCSSEFRDAVLKLATQKQVNVGDLARSAILTLPQEMIEAFPDPGEPEPHDRDHITLKSGDYSGKNWKRKPRLQVRLPKGYQPVTLRKALGLSLALANQKKTISLQNANEASFEQQIEKLKMSETKLHETIRLIAFIPRQGCTTMEEALYILGLPRYPHPSDAQIKKRYRDLAAIFHPDGICGDHERMSELNLAFNFIRGKH